MSDLRSKLVLSQSYNDLCQDLESKLQKLQSQNEALQSSLDVDEDRGEFYRQLKLQRAEMDTFTGNIKELIAHLDKQSKGIDGKNKLKRYRDWFQREMGRNKAIFTQLMARSSFGSSSKVSDTHSEPQDQPVQVNTIETNFVIQPHGMIKQIQYSKKQDSSMFASEWDNTMLKQNQEDLDIIVRIAISYRKDFQSNNLRKCVADLSQEVTRQDNDLDIIADLGLQAKQNVLNANEDLSEANETSKGSRKWYYALLLVAVFLVVGLIVVVYLSNGF